MSQLETPAGEQDGVWVGWSGQGRAAMACVGPSPGFEQPNPSARFWTPQQPLPGPQQPDRVPTAPLLWGRRPEQQSLCVLTALALGSPPCVSERASGIEGKPCCKKGGWGRSSLWPWLLFHPCTGSHRGWCTGQGSTRGTGRIWLHHPAQVQQPLTAEHSNPLIHCRARLSEPQSPRGGISNKNAGKRNESGKCLAFLSPCSLGTQPCLCCFCRACPVPQGSARALGGWVGGPVSCHPWVSPTSDTPAQIHCLLCPP